MLHGSSSEIENTVLRVVGKTYIAMVKSKQQGRGKGNGKGKWREQRTPQRNLDRKEEKLVIGSSCTWRDEQLSHFGVDVRKDVNVWDMIPQEFFDFSHLVDYQQCISPSLYLSRWCFPLVFYFLSAVVNQANNR